MNNNDLEILKELHKGCIMGVNSLNVVLSKGSSKSFRKVIYNLLKEYDYLVKEINNLYSKYSIEGKLNNDCLSKLTVWYSINIRTIIDDSDSNLAKMTLQGLTMGIIDGEKLLKNTKLDKRVISLIESYIDVQEEFVEKIKEFL